MKVNELMIGDWVYCETKICKVTEVYLSGAISVSEDLYYYLVGVDVYIITEPKDIRPIPLTQEILEKNFPEDDILAWWNTHNNKFHIEITDYLEYNELGQELRLDIAYVHDLQHALKLCGIEKEIEL